MLLGDINGKISLEGCSFTNNVAQVVRYSFIFNKKVSWSAGLLDGGLFLQLVSEFIVSQESLVATLMDAIERKQEEEEKEKL